MLRTLLAALCVLILHQVPARAEMTVKEYQKDVRSSDRLKSGAIVMYVTGLGQGISWANSVAAKANAPLYCQPPNLSLNGTNYLNILDKMIQTFESNAPKKKIQDFPVGMVLLMGLQQTFPCQSEK